MSLENYLPNGLPQTPTLVETIVRTLRQAILEGTLAGGTQMRQEELARRMGVSRVPIREALLRLQGEGLVETQPRRGVVVTALSHEDFEEILEMRYALESLAVGLAARRFTDEDLRAVMQVVDEATTSLEAVGDSDLKKQFESRWGDLNWEFHRRLYAPANRPRLLTAIGNLHNLFARHVRMRLERGARVEATAESADEQRAANRQEWAAVIEEHRQMALACAHHDAKLAQRILRDHISAHGAELVRRLRDSPGTPTARARPETGRRGAAHANSVVGATEKSS